MVAEVPLRGGGMVVVDDDDVALVAGRKWSLLSTAGKQYARHQVFEYAGQQKMRYVSQTFMHRLIMNAPAGVEVDHIDGDGLNNRRSNLRLVTHQQNLRNRRGAQRNSRSGVRNVHWSGRKRKWVVGLRVEDRWKYIGQFDDLARAGEAALAARRRYYGNDSDYVCAECSPPPGDEE